MALAWMPRDAPLPYPLHLRAPLYLSAERQSVVAEVQLPLNSAQEAAQWTLAGVALVLAG